MRSWRSTSTTCTVSPMRSVSASRATPRCGGLATPEFLQLPKRNLIVGLDVKRIAAQLVGDQIHLIEQVHRRRRQVNENRMTEAVIVIAHGAY
jgi:hypothetical protein